MKDTKKAKIQKPKTKPAGKLTYKEVLALVRQIEKKISESDEPLESQQNFR